MSFNRTLQKFGIEQMVNQLYKNPEKNLRTLMDWADRFAGGEFQTQRAVIRETIENPEHPYYPFARRLISDLDPKVMKTLVTNFFILFKKVVLPVPAFPVRKRLVPVF